MPQVETQTTFRIRFEAAAQRNHSLLCVGLDPDPGKIPAGVSVRDFLMGIVEATSDVVACYKPNIAFFEPWLGEGIEILHDVIRAIPHDVPVILDAKRGDIGNTSEAYARAVFESMGAHAVTLNPYLGYDGVEPFFRYADRHSFLLCRTSNPGAADVQDLQVDGHPLYERIAYLANQWNTRGNVGLVVGATYPAEAARIREICPDLLFLMPGVGAQDGDLEAAVKAGMDARGAGIAVNASRGVLYAGAGSGSRWADASRDAAVRLRDQINAARAR